MNEIVIQRVATMPAQLGVYMTVVTTAIRCNRRRPEEQTSGDQR